MNTETLQKKIEQTPALMLYFQNDLCPPCQSLRPKIQELAAAFPLLELVYIDTATHRLFSAHYFVFAAPTLLVFFEGREFIRTSKYVSVDDLRQKIKRVYDVLFAP